MRLSVLKMKVDKLNLEQKCIAHNLIHHPPPYPHTRFTKKEQFTNKKGLKKSINIEICEQ